VVFEVQLSKISQEELQEREEKYARDGIESYWLLRNYLDLLFYYEMDDEEDCLDCLNLDESEFSLTHEKFYYVQKGIRTIGINSDNQTLCTTKKPSTGLMDWVKYTLSGDYSHYLVEYKAQYQRYIKLRKTALPILYELAEFEQKYDEYERAPYKLYAIFKNNTWDDCASLNEEIKLMYALFRRFENALTDIFSPRNGFTWKTDPGSGENTDNSNSSQKIRSPQSVSKLEISKRSRQSFHRGHPKTIYEPSVHPDRNTYFRGFYHLNHILGNEGETAFHWVSPRGGESGRGTPPPGNGVLGQPHRYSRI
jgi:hypothetical protein